MSSSDRPYYQRREDQRRFREEDWDEIIDPATGEAEDWEDVDQPAVNQLARKTTNDGGRL